MTAANCASPSRWISTRVDVVPATGMHWRIKQRSVQPLKTCKRRSPPGEWEAGQSLKVSGLSLSAKFLATGLAALILILTSCSQGPFGRNTSTQNTAALAKVARASELTVFRSPTCGCCGKWVEPMQAFGFQIKDNITEDMEAIAEQYGIPDQLRSCHTAIANGYVIEGHIPAVDVARLLQETPTIAGIAVPAMSVSSPGMESGYYVEPYSVLTFDEAGEIVVFSEHS